VDLHQENAPALLDELRGSGAAGNFYATFGVDVHADEAALVKDFLDGFDGVIVVCVSDGAVESCLLLFREWLAEEFKSLGDALDLSFERLSFDASDDGEVVCEGDRCEE
jgi:hypothetical protein